MCVIYIFIYIPTYICMINTQFFLLSYSRFLFEAFSGYTFSACAYRTAHQTKSLLNCLLFMINLNGKLLSNIYNFPLAVSVTGKCRVLLHHANDTYINIHLLCAFIILICSGNVLSAPALLHKGYSLL